MEEYSVDVVPDQIIRWLRAHEQINPGTFAIRSSREFIDAAIDSFENDGISVDTDVGSVMVVGIVEIRAAQEPRDWVLRIRAEDALGDHVPEDHSVTPDPEEIDLETFEEWFVRPGRAAIDATVLAESDETRARLDDIFDAMMSNRHPD